jgi:AcrR family transcriptional regulator
MLSNTRDNLVKVSFNLFMQNSYKEVTIKEIVDKAGVSQGAFFHYFKNKEQLFLEIVEMSFASVGSIYKNLNTKSLCRFYHDYVDSLIESAFIAGDYENDENLVWNYISFIFEALKIFPHLGKRIAELHELEMNVWKNVIFSARESGEIKSKMSDELIASTFIFSSDGLGMRGIYNKYTNEELKKSILAHWDSIYESIKS